MIISKTSGELGRERVCHSTHIRRLSTMAGEIKIIVGAAVMLLLTSVIVRSNRPAAPAG